MGPAATFEVDRPNAPYREGMVDLVARCQIAAENELNDLPESAARKVALIVEGTPRVEPASGNIIVPVRVINGSHLILSSSDSGRAYGSYHWISAESAETVKDGIRSGLPCDIWPDDGVSFGIRAILPPHVGRWRLQVRVVQEGVRWHEGPGFEAAMPPDIIIDLFDSGRVVFPEN